MQSVKRERYERDALTDRQWEFFDDTTHWNASSVSPLVNKHALVLTSSLPALRRRVFFSCGRAMYQIEAKLTKVFFCRLRERIAKY